MKKLFALLTALMFSFATLTQVQALPFGGFQTTKHVKKNGTPDKRYKENKAPKGPLTKSGKPDMRYKANNPNAGKKKKKS
ncbi:MAG TPA: hypothetical protein VK671_04590 [Mucilaginibacter sp.]|jgi:hypothetical protein|nr:hypothetical protein [Mucilaginibacter sp.]